MRREVKQQGRAMRRTFLALRRYDHDGRVGHLIKAAASISRTMARNFSAEAARMATVGDPLDIADLRPDASLADEMNYCSDRWNVWRFIRVRRFIESSRPR